MVIVISALVLLIATAAYYVAIFTQVHSMPEDILPLLLNAKVALLPMVVYMSPIIFHHLHGDAENVAFSFPTMYRLNRMRRSTCFVLYLLLESSIYGWISQIDTSNSFGKKTNFAGTAIMPSLEEILAQVKPASAPPVPPRAGAAGSSIGADARAESARKVHVVSSDLEHKVDVALRLSAINASQSRIKAPQTQSEVPIATDGPTKKAYDITHADYLSKTKGNAGHGLGPPDSFRMFGIVYALLNEPNLVQEQEHKQMLQDFVNNNIPGSVQAQLMVSTCRVERMRKKNLTRLIISIRRNIELEDLLVRYIAALEKQGTWSGPRPAGWLELEAQRLLPRTSDADA